MCQPSGQIFSNNADISSMINTLSLLDNINKWKSENSIRISSTGDFQLGKENMGCPLHCMHWFFWKWQFSTVSMDILKTDKNWENIFFSSSIIYKYCVCTNGQKNDFTFKSHKKPKSFKAKNVFTSVSIFFGWAENLAAVGKLISPTLTFCYSQRRKMFRKIWQQLES